MEHFRKVWDDEKDAWLKAHKDMARKDAYALFCKVFHDADISQSAFNTRRSVVGAAKYQRRGRCRALALYSERVKKGYVRIKIAQPNVWISKGAWVYMETHPWEDFSEKSHYIFLDGNSRNFSPDNIERVPFKIMAIFGNLGGRVQGNPDLTRLNIARAKLISARLDAGERLGLTLRQGPSRIFREEANNRMRIYRSDPERRKLINERAREYYRRVKSENPQKYEEIRKRHREYMKNRKIQGME